MNRFRRQFSIGFLLLVLFGLGAGVLHHRLANTLPHYAYLTGWVLFAVMIILAAYNARKKIPFLPLGSSEAWLQFHVYSGFFTVLLFLIHIRFRVPTGWFEGVLAWLYVLVTLTGIAGLFLTRTLPRRLATRGCEAIYEKIPAQRHALRLEAESIALGETSASPAIAEYYVRSLSGFFSRPQNFWRHLAESRGPVNSILAELNDLRRYLPAPEQAKVDQIAALIQQKDGLDYHHALQFTLKLWLFTHLPLTYSLMIFSLLHIVIVYAFSGGAR